MKQTFLYMLMAVLTLTFGACSSDDGPQQDPTPKVDLDDDQTTAELNESYTYKLPVIFHVFYKDEAEMKQKVTASRLADMLDHVNHIYQGGYYSTDIGTSENINIRFNLATHDERGNRLATPGVEYVKWDGTYPIDANDFMNNNKKGYARYLWEPNDYINVMVYPFAPEANSAEVTLGVSHLPFTLKGVNETDGLSALESKYNDISKKNLSFAYCSSINSDFIDYEVDRYTNASHNITSGTLNQAKFDINVTLAHELGHYLGLLHAFSEKEDANGNLLEDACDDTDYCTDTPSYNRPAYLRRVTALLNNSQVMSISFKELAERTSCRGDKFFSTNIMDYAYTYAFELTAQQKARIRRVLYNSPLIPGPKQRLRTKSRVATGSADDMGVIDLPIRVVK